MRERPDLAAWWIAQEQRIGGTFVSGDSYTALVDRVRRLPMLPMDLDPTEDAAGGACACTD